VLQPGEDVAAGETVLTAGSRLKPAAIGGLMALGLTTATVARRPTVAIISSGDEVVAPGRPLGPGQVYDVNTYALQALIAAAGAAPLSFGIIPDDAVAFRAAAEEALAAADIVVFTAGSSVSVRDLTAHTIDALGTPGVLVHGVSVRPGKPTILAACDGKAVIGLPGNPVSALLIARRFLVPLIDRLLGAAPAPVPQIGARLMINLSSASGREDWVPVRLRAGKEGLEAEPIFGKSNLIFTLAKADGLVCVPAAANGLPAGSDVQVELL
jgi:molybdopterin molybdotransferase